MRHCRVTFRSFLRGRSLFADDDLEIAGMHHISAKHILCYSPETMRAICTNKRLNWKGCAFISFLLQPLSHPFLLFVFVVFVCLLNFNAKCSYIYLVLKILANVISRWQIKFPFFRVSFPLFTNGILPHKSNKSAKFVNKKKNSTSEWSFPSAVVAPATFAD